MQKSLLAGLAMALAVTGCNGYSKENFTAALDGAQVVPAVTPSPASGTLNLTFNGPVAEWTLTVAGGGLASTTGIHIHDGAVGTTSAGNNNLLVVLYDGPAAGGTPGTVTTLHGSFIADQVTACATAPAAAGTTACQANRSFANVQAGAEGGTIYADAHTTVNTTGAIRGQIH